MIIVTIINALLDHFILGFLLVVVLPQIIIFIEMHSIKSWIDGLPFWRQWSYFVHTRCSHFRDLGLCHFSDYLIHIHKWDNLLFYLIFWNLG